MSAITSSLRAVMRMGYRGSRSSAAWASKNSMTLLGTGVGGAGGAIGKGILGAKIGLAGTFIHNRMVKDKTQKWGYLGGMGHGFSRGAMIGGVLGAGSGAVWGARMDRGY